MHAPEESPQPVDPQRHLVDLQYEEVSSARLGVLNRESARLRAEGWSVQHVEDHLIATRRESGHSQRERMLVAVGGFLALAYAATLFLSSVVESLPVPELVIIGAAAALGAAIAFFTRGQAARDRRVTVSVDGHGRPFQVEQRRDF